jgi:hypothetical protein
MVKNYCRGKKRLSSVGRIESETQEHHIMAFRALACRLRTPSVPVPRLLLALALHRALRPLAGPLLAFRVAFMGRSVA